MATKIVTVGVLCFGWNFATSLDYLPGLSLGGCVDAATGSMNQLPVVSQTVNV